MLGVFLVIAIELLGVRSLSFAVGSYLSIATTTAIFAGGAVRWLVERNKPKTAESESEVSPGALYSSGLIAAGGVFGLLAIIIKLMEIRGWVTPDKFNVGDKMDRQPGHERLARRRDVRAARVVAIHFCAQEAGVDFSSTGFSLWISVDDFDLANRPEFADKPHRLKPVLLKSAA